MKKFLYLFLPTLLLLSGCNNFLQGSNLIEDLDKQIEYANLESNYVRISTRSQNHGTIFPNGDVEFKKGYPVTLELTLNENYTFIRWCVINKETKKEEKKVFKFEQKESSTNKVIIADATILDNYQNLQIYPLCKQIKDNSAPKINDDYNFAVSEELLGTQNEILTKKYTEWTNEDLLSAHTKSVWVDMSFFEIDFEDIKNYSLEVTETLLKDTQGNTSNSQTNFLITEIFEQMDDDGNFSLKYEYPFTSGADGIVQLDFAIIDSSDNKSDPITCYVLKDTSIQSKIKLLSYAENNKTYENILNDSNNFYFSVSDLVDNWYNQNSTSVSDMELLLIEDSDEEDLTEYSIPHSEVNSNYNFEIPSDFSSTDDNLFNIVIRDSCKNELYCSAPKFSAPSNNFLYLYDSSNKKLKIVNQTEDEELIIYYSDFNPAQNTTSELNYVLMKTGICVLDNIDLDTKNYYLFSQKIINGGKLGTDSHISSITNVTKSITKNYDSTVPSDSVK